MQPITYRSIEEFHSFTPPAAFGGTPLREGGGVLTPHSSLLTPHSSLFTLIDRLRY